MKRPPQKKILPVLFIFYIFIFSLGFKKTGPDNGRKEGPFPLDPKIQILNQGQPFQIKSPSYAAHEVLVKFKPFLSEKMINATIAAYRSQKLKRILHLDVYQIQIPEKASVKEMIYALKLNPYVMYAEPNYIAHIEKTPNDTLFKYQYALSNSGQEVGPAGSPRGTSSADIKATAAWEETMGAEETLIAIIDTGADLKHADLQNKIKSSGHDFVNNDDDATDDHGHGTFVAGIAAADTNNNEGIAGVAWNCKILPVKVMGKDGQGYYSWIIDGISWAVANGARVINLSLGGEFDSEALKAAVRYASEKNVVVAAAAGNDGGAVLYPAAYDDYCLAVAATDYNDHWADWSNSGPQVDVAAPGVEVLSTVPTWYFEPKYLPYGFASGTSAATPHVAGLAALIRTIKPWLSAGEIMNIIRFSADDINSSEHPGKDGFIGYGRINMEKALVPIKIKK
jgi:subtilisin family serine protease